MAQSTKRKPTRVFPAPALIDNEHWKVQPTNRPRVVFNDRGQGKHTMHVNLSDNPYDRNVRCHELGHVKFTPKNAKFPKDISNLAIQCIEDARINYLLRRAGIDMLEGAPLNIVQGAALATKNDPRARVQVQIADLRGEANCQIRPYLEPQLADYKGPEELEAARQVWKREQEIIRLAHSFLGRYKLSTKVGAINSATGVPNPTGHSKPYSWKRTLHVAKWLDDVFAEAERREAEDAKNSAPGMEEKDDTPEHEAKALAKEIESLSSQWGKMWFERPQLSVPKSTARQRGPRCDSEGDTLRAPWRVTIDGACFKRTSRAAKTGTILIDGSGSMRLTPEMVQAFAVAIPASTIAAYHGEPGGARADAHGVESMQGGPVRILAKKGRLAADKTAYELNGGNVIDGPALVWLSRQPQPRIWVCDGLVTGKGDRSAPHLYREADAIMKRGHILRFDTPAEALAYLKTRQGKPNRLCAGKKAFYKLG